jgi:hypothetical protein
MKKRTFIIGAAWAALVLAGVASAVPGLALGGKPRPVAKWTTKQAEAHLRAGVVVVSQVEIAQEKAQVVFDQSNVTRCTNNPDLYNGCSAVTATLANDQANLVLVEAGHRVVFDPTDHLLHRSPTCIGGLASLGSTARDPLYLIGSYRGPRTRGTWQTFRCALYLGGPCLGAWEAASGTTACSSWGSGTVVVRVLDRRHCTWTLTVIDGVQNSPEIVKGVA